MLTTQPPPVDTPAAVLACLARRPRAAARTRWILHLHTGLLLLALGLTGVLLLLADCPGR